MAPAARASPKWLCCGVSPAATAPPPPLQPGTPSEQEQGRAAGRGGGGALHQDALRHQGAAAGRGQPGPQNRGRRRVPALPTCLRQLAAATAWQQQQTCPWGRAAGHEATKEICVAGSVQGTDMDWRHRGPTSPQRQPAITQPPLPLPACLRRPPCRAEQQARGRAGGHRHAAAHRGPQSRGERRAGYGPCKGGCTAVRRCSCPPLPCHRWHAPFPLLLLPPAHPPSACFQQSFDTLPAGFLPCVCVRVCVCRRRTL